MPVSHPKWYNGLLSPQLFIYLIGGVIAIVVFWTKTQESWEKIKVLEDKINKLENDKTDKEETKAVSDRVSRQYEQFNKISDRLTEQEKAAAYQKGLHEAPLHEK